MRSFNINRKKLSLILCFILICVLSLTVAYAVLSVTLNIVGNAEIVASNWDIHLANPIVRDGSVNNNVPVIAGNEMTFSANLSNPGDYYEFIVDVVNDGSIDAMIDSIVKTPEFTNEQTKYIKFDVSYQNGESISAKQTLYKGTSTPIKVRIEFRKDLEVSDLPTTTANFNFKLTLVYVQSDGTENSVKDNGAVFAYANGDINQIGTIVTIGTERFYVIGENGDNVKLLAKYNLYVGGYFKNGNFIDYGDEATGIQNSNMFGYLTEMGGTKDGIVVFADDVYWHESSYPSYVYDNNSLIYSYVNNYKKYLENTGIFINEARLPSSEEIMALGCESSIDCSSAPAWVYMYHYWTGTANTFECIHVLSSMSLVGNGSPGLRNYKPDGRNGVRPVIEISKHSIMESDLITFTVDDIVYQAYDGMTWEEWVVSDFGSKDDFGVESDYIGHLWNDIDEAWYKNVYLDNEISDIVLKDDTIIPGHAYYCA